MNALNYYVTCSHIQVLIGQQAYFTRQIVLFDTQRTKLRSIVWEFLVENETTEQMNETAQQVSERKTVAFDYVLLGMGTFVNANKITFWSVWCVCNLY